MAVTGFVEFAGTNYVRGWAYDSDAPMSRLEVAVRIGDEFYASAIADISRSDLLAAGIGDGCHGFDIDVSEAKFSAAELAALEIHAISGVDVVRIERVAAGGEPLIDLASDPSMAVSDATQFPVFVLGPARSGTSAMTLALLESGSYLGMGEGHLMPLAHALLSAVDRHYYKAGDESNTLRAKVPATAFQKLIRRAFVQLASELFPSPRWLDKTPTVEMVRASVLMQELWPNARFIFMKRRVIENLLSRKRKFPGNSTDNHFSDWAAVMSAWLAVRERLGSAALEIDHRQLVLDPHAVASAVAQFLDLPESAGARFVRYLSQSRPEQTDENFGATYALEDLGLSEAERQSLVSTCDPVMQAFGYGYGAEYYGPGA